MSGRRELTFALPPADSIDLELAATAIEQAEAALAVGEARAAWDDARIALALTDREFLPGFDYPWAHERRRDVEELRLRSLECAAGAGICLGGAGLPAAERAARELLGTALFVPEIAVGSAGIGSCGRFVTTINPSTLRPDRPTCPTAPVPADRTRHRA